MVFADSKDRVKIVLDTPIKNVTQVYSSGIVAYGNSARVRALKKNIGKKCVVLVLDEEYDAEDTESDLNEQDWETIKKKLRE